MNHSSTVSSLCSPASLLWGATFCGSLIWSAIAPYDYFTWFLEVLPALIGALLLLLTHNRFRFSRLSYALILLHCIILMIGGHYTYAKVPLFDTLAELFSWQRNNYDKLGHFAQGFVPAAIAREIFIRRQVTKSRAWCNLFVVSFCLAFSAFYELIEWWVALATGEDAEAFLGTQGYVWDTQSDMMLALIGALCFVTLCSRLQDSSIQKV